MKLDQKIGYDDESEYFYNLHKLERMINVVNKICEYSGCNIKRIVFVKLINLKERLML